MEIRNRKINNYEIESRLVAGLVLIGMEIKSLVKKEVDITGSRCMLRNSPTCDIYLVGSYFKQLESNFSAKYEANRDRLLLLKKSELRYIQQELQKGRVIIPTRVFRAESGKYKVEIAICRPLKKYDKREKEREKQDWKESRD